jgi:hypothetical protein
VAAVGAAIRADGPERRALGALGLLLLVRGLFLAGLGVLVRLQLLRALFVNLVPVLNESQPVAGMVLDQAELLLRVWAGTTANHLDVHRERLA